MEDRETVDPGSAGTACYPPVLDACCGGRMMWFDKRNPLALFQDKRSETFDWDDAGLSRLEVRPDVVGDFTAMEFPDDTFYLVVFDPPHMNTLGENSKLGQMYGRLFGNWRCEIGEGFKECHRVLRPGGVLVFKWNESDISVEAILDCAKPWEPLFGHSTKRHGKTHWFCFMKSPAVGG